MIFGRKRAEKVEIGNGVLIKAIYEGMKMGGGRGRERKVRGEKGKEEKKGGEGKESAERGESMKLVR